MNEVTSRLSHEKMYDIVRFPIVTEKSTMVSSFRCVIFQVPLDASKPEIRRAVEEVFGVKVGFVNTSVLKGKVKRFRGRKGRRSDVKKAFVGLAEGYSIDIAAEFSLWL